MTRNPRETQIDADPGLPVIRIVREFDARPEHVFRAWVEPELIVQWLGPRDLETRLDRWDATTGGSYRYGQHRNGQEIAAFYGSFHEVRPSSRLVQTFTWAGMPDGVSLDTMTFEALPGDRTRVVAVSVVESIGARDAILASGMERGVVEGYLRLDALLARD